MEHRLFAGAVAFVLALWAAGGIGVTPPGEFSRRSSLRAATLAIGAFLTLTVAGSTWLDLPSSDWRGALYTALGLLISLAAAYSAGTAQEESVETQKEIHKFLMEKVNSRSQRTATVISLCENAEQMFRAVTYFPVVGVQDAPDSAPREYLNALEKLLEGGTVEVTLVSVTCAEAREFAIQRNFGQDSLNALEAAEKRLDWLKRRYPGRFRMTTVPGSAITINVCHNHEAALIYFMSAENDKGYGFKSNDSLIRDIAEGSAIRYSSYRERERKSSRHPFKRR
jgi:hypothetical protein